MAESVAVLKTRLVEAREALHKVMLGDKVEQVGFGVKRLTQWNKTNVADLKAYIAQLESEIARAEGAVPRGPIYPVGDVR